MFQALRKGLALRGVYNLTVYLDDPIVWLGVIFYQTYLKTGPCVHPDFGQQ